MASSKIVTGQYVTLNQNPGSLADRVLGQLIDNIVLIAYIVVISFAFLDSSLSRQMSDNAYAVLLIALYLPALFYHPLM